MNSDLVKSHVYDRTALSTTEIFWQQQTHFPSEKFYRVITTGALKDGVKAETVISKLAYVFKTSHDKARKLIGHRVIVKKALPFCEARAFKRKFESLGMQVELQAFSQTHSYIDRSISAKQTTQAEHSQAECHKVQQAGEDQTNRLGKIHCPKCQYQQTKGDAKCGRCGVYFHKLKDKSLNLAFLLAR